MIPNRDSTLHARNCQMTDRALGNLKIVKNVRVVAVRGLEVPKLFPISLKVLPTTTQNAHHSTGVPQTFGASWKEKGRQEKHNCERCGARVDVAENLLHVSLRKAHDIERWSVAGPGDGKRRTTGGDEERKRVDKPM